MITPGHTTVALNALQHYWSDESPKSRHRGAPERGALVVKRNLLEETIGSTHNAVSAAIRGRFHLTRFARSEDMIMVEGGDESVTETEPTVM